MDARQQAFWGQTATGSLYRLAAAADPLFPWLTQEFGDPGVMSNAQVPLLWRVVVKLHGLVLLASCWPLTLPGNSLCGAVGFTAASHARLLNPITNSKLSLNLNPNPSPIRCPGPSPDPDPDPTQQPRRAMLPCSLRAHACSRCGLSLSGAIHIQCAADAAADAGGASHARGAGDAAA